MNWALVGGLISNSTTFKSVFGKMVPLTGKNVVIVGASRGVGRAIARRTAAEGAHVLAVGREPAALEQLARELPGMKTLAIDAAAEAAPASVFAALRPDLLVLCAGAIPPGRPIHELTWEEFAINWETDVKLAFLFCREALRLPLSAGATVIVISSGAALGGSPISGGYAGAKRTQMFIANYAQKESQRLALGIRFFALAPASSRQTPEDVANATAELATDFADCSGRAFTISGDGITPAE